MRLTYLGYAGTAATLTVDGHAVRVGEQLTLSAERKAALEKHGHRFAEMPEEPPKVERKAAKDE